jgi:hypothetical protein
MEALRCLRGPALFRRENRAKLDSRMTNPNKSVGKNIDDILRDRARRLTRRVITDQHHLKQIEWEVKGIKRIVRKHVKRHR